MTMEDAIGSGWILNICKTQNYGKKVEVLAIYIFNRYSHPFEYIVQLQ